MLDDEKLAKQLSTSSYKLTRQRRAVLSVIASTDGHLNAAEVYEKAKSECPQIGLTTVYRTLDILVELGAIKRVHLDEGCHSYAPASRGHHHHLVCTDCGRAVEFEGCDLSPFLDAVASQTDFEIEEHWLQLFGKCPTCQKTR
ncbi:MAG: transcriptional repressor [Bacillota bacterium]